MKKQIPQKTKTPTQDNAFDWLSEDFWIHDRVAIALEMSDALKEFITSGRTSLLNKCFKKWQTIASALSEAKAKDPHFSGRRAVACLDKREPDNTPISLESIRALQTKYSVRKKRLSLVVNKEM